MTLLYLAAGEASGDILGARLIAALRARDATLQFAGIGGERMAEQEFSSLFDIRQLALMGIAEVLPSLFRLKQRMAEAVADITARRPRLIITIDSPGFTLRLAARVRHLGIPILHYVAPQVWAWRPGRVKKIATRVDRILALLPFEAPIFEAAGIPVDFVGHPILESEAAHGVAARAPGEGQRLIIMPGSRQGEVSRLLPIFADTLRRLPDDIHPIIGLAGTVEEAVRAQALTWGRPVSMVRTPQDKADAFAGARAGLIKSGTSSLEAAVAGLPHAIGYTFNPLSNAIIRRLFRVKYASLVNLLVDEPVVPEFLLEHCEPVGLSAAIRRLLQDDGAVERQRDGFARALARLNPARGLPSEAAADAVLRQL